MTTLWIVLLILAVIVLTPVIVGSFMPERYTGRIRARFDATPEKVWNALLDYRSHPMTGRMMKSVEPPPADQPQGDAPTWVEDMGRGERITVTTTEFNPPRRMVRTMQSAAMAMSSTWTYEFESVDSGCIVTVNGDTSIRRGGWIVPIFRFMMVVGGGVRKGLVIQLNMVGSTLGAKPIYAWAMFRTEQVRSTYGYTLST